MLEKTKHALLWTALCAAMIGGSAKADPIPKGWEALNMKPIGYSDVDGAASSSSPSAMSATNGTCMWGHLWHHGWSIIDCHRSRR